MNNRPPAPILWTFGAGLAGLVLLVALLIPDGTIRVALLVGVIGWGLLVARLGLASTLDLFRRPPPPSYDTHLLPVPPRLLLIESLIVIGAALWATSPFFDLGTDTRLTGGELEFLTSTGHFAAQTLREDGFIPLWQPYLGSGRPVIESPFSFVLNPISMVSFFLVEDGHRAIKLSVILYALVASGGGWFFGRALGLGWLGRVLLALLMVGKGNMVATLGVGHFGLATSQAYMPWIFGAAFLVIRGHAARWPVVLLAVAVALQFFAGNVWHMLPTLISIVVLAVAHLPNWRGMRNLIVAGVLTLGLCSITFLPQWINQDLIGDHLPEQDGGNASDPAVILAQFFTGEPLVRQLPNMVYAEAESSFAYTVPGWFALLVFVLVPLGRARLRGMWRFWLAAGVLVLVFTSWGIGGLQPWRWAYNNLPLLGHWRFVGRALGTASIWLAALVAIRADSLWAYLVNDAVGERVWSFIFVHDTASRAATTPENVDPRLAVGRFANSTVNLSSVRIGRSFQVVLAGLSLLAGGQLIATTWNDPWIDLVTAPAPNEICLQWLHERAPDDMPLLVYQGGYDYIYSFLTRDARHTPVEADYRPLPLPFTYAQTDYTFFMMPRYAAVLREMDTPIVEAEGYTPVSGSPAYQGQPCVWEKTDAVPYGYTIRIQELDRLGGAIPTSNHVQPVAILERSPDHVTIAASGSGGARSLAVIQEVAYPGWRATVDGQNVPLESVGGQAGAVLPLSTDTHIVTFIYRPRLVYVGAAITLITALLCIAILLRLDKQIFMRIRLHFINKNVIMN